MDAVVDGIEGSIGGMAAEEAILTAAAVGRRRGLERAAARVLAPRRTRGRAVRWGTRGRMVRSIEPGTLGSVNGFEGSIWSSSPRIGNLGKPGLFSYGAVPPPA